MTAPEGARRPGRTTLSLIRGALLATLVIGLAGTEVELLLLKHTDGVWQLAPIVLIGGALVVTGWCAVSRSASSLRVLQALMGVFLASGAVGVVLHFEGNVTYEQESNPSLSGAELYRSAISGSTPTLAPGTMIQLGLVGLVFTFRHPSLKRSLPDDASPTDRGVS